MLRSSGVVTGGPRWACALCTSAVSAGRRQPLPAITRLDPARPLPTMLPRAGQPSTQTSSKRAFRLAEFEAMLQSGSPERIWAAYSRLVHEAHWGEGSVGQVLTPQECTRVLEVMTRRATLRRSHMHRVLSVLADVRHRRRQVAAAVRHAVLANDTIRMSSLMRELDEWDAVISPRIMNSTIGYIGLSLRRANLSQIDDVLAQLLEAKRDASEAAQFQPKLRSPRQEYAHGDTKSLLGDNIPSILPQRRTLRRQFPDVATYNILLEIVTRLIHRRTRASTPSPEPDDDGDAVAMQELRDTRAEAQYAAMTEKMQSLGLDTKLGPITLELADHLFDAILRHMRSKSLEPDRITYNIMISMYCQLGRHDAVHQVIAILQDKKMLTIETINNVLWKWVTWLPTSASERSSAVDDVVEVYGVLRDNAVQGEMGIKYPKALGHQHPDGCNQTVKRMFGLPNIDLKPDNITYGLAIKILARTGKFSDALGVFKDLVSTPKPTSSEHLQPDLAVFDSFFRGFSRYGRPSQLVHFNHNQPEHSTWTAMENDDQEVSQLALWNMDTFREIFDVFLRWYPDDSTIRAAGRTSLPSESLGEIEAAFVKERRYPSEYGALALDEASDLDQLRQAPSTNQLFWIITALRRVSGDDARWTLAMWQKVHDKFTNKSPTHDVFTWSGHGLDNRLERILSFLQAKVDGADT